MIIRGILLTIARMKVKGFNESTPRGLLFDSSESCASNLHLKRTFASVESLGGLYNHTWMFQTRSAIRSSISPSGVIYLPMRNHYFYVRPTMLTFLQHRRRNWSAYYTQPCIVCTAARRTTGLARHCFIALSS